MILFLLWILCVGCEFNDGVDSIQQLSLSIQWRFDCLQRLSFHWRFMDLYWHNVFDNSMRQPWLYFCYKFDESVVKSLTLLIPYASCHSVFFDDFKVYSDCFCSRFIDPPWHSVFNNSMRQPWFYFCNEFYVSVVNSMTLSIPYGRCHSVLNDDLTV